MYRDKTKEELFDLVKKRESLTFHARIKLQQELLKRNESNGISELNTSIHKQVTEIKEMKYLEQLGFKLEKTGFGLKITRTFKATLNDFQAIIFGVVLILFGIWGFLSFVSAVFNDGDVSVVSLAINIGQIGLGIIGIRFLSGFKRFLDFVGFELNKTDDRIKLKKRFDIQLTEIEKNTSQLKLEEIQGKLILKLEDYEILRANSENTIQKMTLKELEKKLKNH